MKGINRVKKRLADGSTRTYWYAWKGGPPLQGEKGSPEFLASYNAAVATKVAPATGTLSSVLRGYQLSDKFLSRRDRTRVDYIAKIKLIEREFGDFPLAALTDRRTRGVFMAWRDQLALKSRRQADYAWTVLALVLTWGMDRGMVAANPCAKGGRLYQGNRVDKIWTPDDEAAFLRLAPAHLHLPLLLALWTGQRQGDLLRLPWSAYDGSRIRLRQSKTGVPVSFKAGAPLKAALDATPRVCPLILVNRYGKPWTGNAFRTAWRNTQAAAGLASPSTTCVAPPSPGSPWSDAPRLRLPRSPGTRCATCARSSTPTTCTATPRLPTARSPSSRNASATKIAQLRSQLC
jgi:hypothetical protein